MLCQICEINFFLRRAINQNLNSQIFYWIFSPLDINFCESLNYQHEVLETWRLTCSAVLPCMCRGLPRWLCTVRQRLDSALCSSDWLLPTSLLKTYLGGWGRQWVIPVQPRYTRLAHMLFLWKFPSPRMSRMRLPSASKYIICLCQLVIDAHETWELMQSQTFIKYLLYPYMVSSMVKSECFEVGSS